MASRLDCLACSLPTSPFASNAVLVEVHPDGGTVSWPDMPIQTCLRGADEGTGYQVLEAVGPGDFRHGSADVVSLWKSMPLFSGPLVNWRAPTAFLARRPPSLSSSGGRRRSGPPGSLVEEEAGEVVEVAEGLGLTGSFVHGGSTHPQTLLQL